MCAHQVRSYVHLVSTDDPTFAAPGEPSAADGDAVPRYELCVGGRLSPRWATWFDGLSLNERADGTTAIRGPVVDQAALHGLIEKLRDLGIPLLSLTRLHADAPTEQPPIPDHQNPHDPPGAPA